MRKLLFIALALVFAAPAAAQDAAKKAKEICAACHGDDGNGKKEFPDYPKIAGQYPDFLYKALRDYKSGARKNAIMAGMAQPLTDAEMRALAEYFAGQPGTLTTPRGSKLAAQ